MPPPPRRNPDHVTFYINIIMLLVDNKRKHLVVKLLIIFKITKLFNNGTRFFIENIYLNS